MTLNPQALATVRRNLAWRIERFLEQMPDKPDGWQCDHVQRALTCLEFDDHATGERAMLDAERSVRRQLEEPTSEVSRAALLARLEMIR